ncbi:chromosome segregation ATPase [Anaerotaenia torta]|uniref:hypothetical protein n=1 Tax=Anaerotaenia torta TaxID=433293 RepID=UPI003D25FC75
MNTMKKGLFGYKASEVDVALNALREENESLNSTIITLKTQIKNSVSDVSAKACLLEDDTKKAAEELKAVREENQNLLSQIASLSAAVEALQQKNAEASAQAAHLQMQSEDLKQQLEDEHARRKTLERDFNIRAAEIHSAREEAAAANSDPAAAQPAMDAPANVPAQGQKHRGSLDQPSGISLQAYHNMAQMRSEIMEFLHLQMKNYYQLLNENNLKMRSAMEQRQAEYNQMLHEFVSKSSEYFINPSALDCFYNDMNDFTLNTEQLSSRMDEIMKQFIEEAD